MVAVANTGLNYQGGGGDQDMETGDALATAGQDNIINSSTCGCERRGGRHSTTTNVGLVAGNNVVAIANTGLNNQEGGGEVDNLSENHHRHHRGEQELETGDADAFAWQTNVINSSVGEGE